MKKVFAALILIGFYGNLFAQTLNNHILPPPPDAASLGKFGDFPVSMYNGTPNIDIPIWQIELKDIKVPISLSYHAGGIAVTEVSPWVGTGWALNSGGVITRSVRGLPDDGQGGFMTHPYGILPECPDSGTGGYQFFEKAAKGQANDLEPDMFYFNFGGVSGKFVIDQSGNAHTVPYSKIKIKRNPNNPSMTAFISWEITTEDGLIYLFDEQEAAQTISTTTIPGATSSSSSQNYVTSWYLKEIRLPYLSSGTDQKITFTYDAYNMSYIIPDSETKYEIAGVGISWHPNDNTSLTNYVISAAKRIRKISFPNGSIEFLAGKYRHDLQGGQVLDKIVIKNASQTLKTFKLTYNYFSTNSMVEFGSLADAAANTTALTYLRLALKSVQELDGSELQAKAPYLFQYENNTWLPNRLTSKAQDHWGFYNGEVANNTLIPQHITPLGEYVDGAIRSASESFAKAGMLNRITYPTGGYSTFNYELNDTESGLYPYNFTKINSTYSLGMCVNGKPPAFTINDEVTHKAKLKLTFSSTKWPTLSTTMCSNGTYINGQPSTYVYLNIYDVSNPASPVNMNVTGSSVGAITIGYASTNYTTNIELPNGTYQIQARRGSPTGPEVQGGETNFDGIYAFTVSGAQYQLGSKKVGGLRIAEIDDYDPSSNQTIVKKYDYTDNSLSTGEIQYAPQYTYQFTQVQDCAACTDATTNWVIFDVYNSFSNTPLTTMQGGVVGYKKVTVYTGKDINGTFGINGKTEYFYKSIPDFVYNPFDRNVALTSTACYNTKGRTAFPSFPYAPSISMDWDRGLLAQQIDYQNKAGTFIKVKEILNDYKDDYQGFPSEYNSSTDVLAAKAAMTRTVESGEHSFGATEMLAVQYYFISSRFNKLIRKQETVYDSFGLNPVTSKIEYFFDNLSHLQLNRSVLTKSDGSTVTSQNLYPLDYTNTAGFIADMNAANIITKPIETVKYKTVDSTVTILDGQLFNYKASGQVGLLDKLWELESNIALPLGQFKFSNQTASGVLPNLGTSNSYSVDTRYPTTANKSFEYDVSANPIENKTAFGISIAYQWAYNKQYPIAECKNALSTEFYYEGFEESTATGVTTGVAHTGTKFYTGSTFAVNWIRPNARSYVISYWYRSGGIWLLKNEQGYTANTFTLTGGDAYDDIKIYPADAQMVTYTYSPIVGVASSTDVKNQTTTYEYDNFLRLMNVKNKDGNIVKHMDYHYQGQ
ncbi:hypothetical protein [Mucilaginibacter sp. NFX135]|uniref:hypothetical protein n=1 Tax=Mucilaginibacter sp. NFX135 TaxID=3402687 RepID=UPI003AFA9CCC